MTSRLLPFLLALGLAACAPEAPSDGDAPVPEAPAPTADTTASVAADDAPLYSAPDFALATMDGDTLRMTDLRGKVVLVNFWATWCAPCLEEVPDLNDLHAEYADDGLVIVGASEDEGGFADVRPFAEEFGIPYPLVIDERAQLAEAYGNVWALPTSFLVDKDGLIVRRILGVVVPEEIRPQIEELLRAG